MGEMRILANGGPTISIKGDRECVTRLSGVIKAQKAKRAANRAINSEGDRKMLTYETRVLFCLILEII